MGRGLNKGRFLIRKYTYKDILFEYIEVYPILRYILLKGQFVVVWW